MPLYEYTCADCRDDFEILVLGSDEPTCPQCGGRNLHKLISVPASPGNGTNRDPLPPTCSPAGCDLPHCGARRN